MTILLTISFLLGLLILHELGHIFCAIAMKIAINKVGIKRQPLPHLFVTINLPKKRKNELIYLFAGSAITCFVFLIAFFNHLLDYKCFYLALIIQIIIETNPFFSDLTIAISSSSRIRHKEFKNYSFSTLWYLHFILWTILIITCIKMYLS